MIEIEFEEPSISKCDCCGQDIVRLTRFVYQDGDAFGIYYTKFTKGHPDKILHGLIGLGEWGNDAEPSKRLAFPFRIWTIDNHYQVGLTDRKESPWMGETFLGRIVDREEALTHPWINDVFHITDHMVSEDSAIIEYFSNENN